MGSNGSGDREGGGAVRRGSPPVNHVAIARAAEPFDAGRHRSATMIAGVFKGVADKNCNTF